MKSHFWGRLGLGIIILAAVPLSAATNSGPIEAWFDKDWPALLTSEPIRMEPEVALLHERANAALNALLQASEAPE